jgi:uncharacterized ferredoxin-like protein
MKKYVEDLDFQGEEYISEWTPWSPQDIRRKKCALEAARLMVDAAMTAPVAGGVPSVEAHIVYGQEELEAIARKIEDIAHTNEAWKEPFLYEAVMVRDSDVIIFIGNTRCHETPLDAGCGLCGGTLDCGYFYEKKTTKYGLVDITDRSSKRMINGPLCTARVGDLGYAVGSALWTAHTLMVDARPFASLGMAGQKMGYCPKSGMVVGVPLAAKAKNPYVDVNVDYHLINMDKILDNTRKIYQTARIIRGFDYRKWVPKPKKAEEPKTQEEGA